MKITFRVVAMLLVLVASLIVVAVASASQPLGPNDTLYSDYPVNYSAGGTTYVYADGSVQGGYINPNNLSIEICLQVETPTGGWVDKSGSCAGYYPENTYDEVVSYTFPATAGHTYRTWDYATTGNYNATSTSRGWTAP